MNRHIPWEPSPHGGPLGRNVNHDPRSWNYRVTRRATVLRSVRHRRRVPIYDQGNLGSCVAHAGKGCLSTAPFRHRFVSERLIVATYSQLTRLDDIPGQYPPEDTGSDGLSFGKLAKAKGWIPGYQHAMGITDALDALQTHAVITGVDWHEGFDQPNADGLVTISGQVRGGHEFVVDEYRQRGTVPTPAEDLVGCANSWSTRWGLRGRFFMTVSTWARLLEAEGDGTVLTA